MERQEVESSNIKSIGYNKANELLEIEFKSGGVYQYAHVTPAKYAALMEAPSVGRYFSREIRGHNPCEKVD
jgi:hypothetical protein